MRFKRRGLLAAFAGLCLFATVAGPLPASAQQPLAETFTLNNGMQVVVIPDHRAPVVTHMVWYRVGSADEPQGKAGIAHFLEHLMFKGTNKYPPGAFNRIIRENGGEDNAFTSKDYTAYFQRIAKDRLGLVMDLEADRMQNLVLKDENVLPELKVVEEERRERTDNDPSSLLGEQLDAILYLAHPYRKPVIGWMSEVNKLTREDAITFYKAHYTPANAILVVAGDVTKDEVQKLAEEHYGKLANTFDVTSRVRTDEPEPIAPRRVTLTDARAASPLVQRQYLSVSYATAAKGEAEALDVLAEAMGGGATSRLYKKLVVEKRIASYAAAWYSGDGLDSGTFGVYGSPVPGGKVDVVEAEIDAVLDDIKANGITDEELKRAKTKLIANTIYARDNQGNMARSFGTALTTGTTVQDVLDWPSRIEAVTLDQVKAAAAKTLDIKRSATGVLLPAAGAAAGGGAPATPSISNSPEQ
ncbi:M16 family metallopeptidase [Aestuariivirga sp. YIM B02566]|uniref:Insulinase family protein n=1 Tax=Taklimakanibacter albus TaxID=2800327 RepID=A0ACC5R9X0_9HYPH|nr:pitrilysin family protein [Aestuariivirga sp. YIM B02566]MBK1869464.1 insulinase family protein [Aestuariivirga sp. YIM B02566]